MEKEIAKFSKNAAEEIIVKLTNFRNRDLIDIRIWNKPLLNEEQPKATKKGICIRVEQIPELLESLKKAEKAYSEELDKRVKEEINQG